MPSVTSWTRLEPRTRTAGLTPVEARIADPLWLLGRQWQIGELQGEDAGSPVQAKLSYSASRLSRWAPSLPPAAAARVLGPDVPLDVLVEAEGAPASPAATGWDLRIALEAGLRLLELLGARAADGAGPLAAAYGPLPPDPSEPPDAEAARLRALAAGRVPDGRRLWTPLNNWRHGSAAAPPGVDADDQAVVDAVDAWLAWYAGRPGGGAAPRAWRPERLEYEFSLAAHTTVPGPTPAPVSAETVLVATDHGGRDLDWHAVDIWPQQTMGALNDPKPSTNQVSLLPTSVTFPGMPTARWWQVEEGDVDLTALHPAPEDLGRLLFTEFALNYGNDFFWLPLELPVGSVTKVESLQVTTSFGDVVQVPTTASADRAAKRVAKNAVPWAMFAPSVQDTGAGVADPAPYLVVLPLAGQPLFGQPVEDVLFSRDEMADVAWALERLVPGPSGRAVDRHELWQRSRPDPEPAPGVPHRPSLSYELATSVPPYWFPMLNRPGPASSNRSTVLELQALQPVLGTLLEPGSTLNEERLSRTGLRLTRRWKRSRSSDGRTRLWTARRVEPGTGESTSGLTFDVLRGE
jgi:hypothetical protein